MNLIDAVLQDFQATSGQLHILRESQLVSGGCINQALDIKTDRGHYFLKFNRAELLSMFEAEADGLRELAGAESIRLPQPLLSGCAGDQAYLLMEFLPTGGRGSMRQFGQQLAGMHAHTGPAFGWHRENTIGATPQPNKQSDDWCEFWREQRLGFQLELARRNGCGARLYDSGQRLMQDMSALFTPDQPQASVLHGDLWSGNYAFTTQGKPVIFDPAVYFGDREADIAMTELFGGFSADFYAAYNEVWPLDVGYPVRKKLYNLYHILNHYNLFGGGYAAQAQRMIEQLLGEL